MDKHMQRCLDLAVQGRGLVGNGALVGAVLVRDTVSIAEGFHAGFGKLHAERDLLNRFTGDILPGDVLYVNLEPCCHHGKTPPCTDSILQRGIKHVVYGMRDPDTRVSGHGIEALRRAGVTVRASRDTAACEYVNRGFISVRTNGRPWITLKQARMPDGSIANMDGSPKNITSNAQNIWSHYYLRARSDAIIVGVGTIITDNPKLTIRHHEGAHQPYRIVLDPHLRLPENSRVVTDEYRERTIICTDKNTSANEVKKNALQASGVRVVSVDMHRDTFDWAQLWQALTAPADDYIGMTSVLVEGGRRTWDLFRRNGMMDEEVTLVGVPS